MSAPLQFSDELKASIERLKARTWRDHDAQAFEQGAIPTKPAVPSAKQVVGSHFRQRPCRRRRTDEERVKRRERKRMLGGSSAMPSTIRHHYTEGERSVGCVVAGECKRHGFCDLSIDEIADRAGVSRTTVQNYQHEARRLGHIRIKNRPRRGAKSLTNVITVASAEWLTWIKRAPSAALVLDRVQFSKNVNTTKSIDLRKEEAWRCKRADRQRDPPKSGGVNVA
jgi:hypothetical protein